MKLFLALTLVANLHAPANAADLLVAAVADNINANADLLIEAVAAADADDVDADDINATPSQVDFNNQVDEVCMHNFSAVIYKWYNNISCRTHGNVIYHSHSTLYVETIFYLSLRPKLCTNSCVELFQS